MLVALAVLPLVLGLHLQADWQARTPEVIRAHHAPASVSWHWYALPLVGHALDAGSTIYFRSRGRLEGNRRFYGLVPLYGSRPSPGQILAIKGASCGAHLGLVYALDRTGHPRAAKAISALGVGFAGLGAWNLSVTLTR